MSLGYEKLARTPLYKYGRDFTSLTDKQQKFVSEYMLDFNAAGAARRAGYKKPGTAGPKLMSTNNNINRILGKYKREMLVGMELKKDAVIEQLKYGLQRSAKDLVDDKGQLIQNIKDLPDHVAMTIDSIEQDVYRRLDREGNVISETLTTRYKMNRKSTYIDMSMKHLGMYEAQQHNVNHTLDWDSLTESDRESEDTIEGEIMAIGNEG